MSTPDNAAVPLKAVWLKALADIGEDEKHDPDALTIEEFSEMFGLTRSTAERRLGALVSAGRAVRTKKVARKHGRRIVYVAYRLTEPPRARRPR